MHPAKFAISQLVVGAPKTTHGLSMFPLRTQSECTVDYLLLRDAFVAGLVTVREVSERGSISDLEVDNRADRSVLIVDGEELVGAKQNRVANLTLLLPAEKKTRVPVSCVEQGRWSRPINPFVLSERMHHYRGRAAKLASVQASMRFEGSRHSDQSEVWEEIRAKSTAMDAASPTGAMGVFFDRHASTLDEMVAYFRPQPEHCGGIFAIGDALCGLDLFDKPAIFAALLPKLVRSYGIDALEQGRAAEAGAPSPSPPDMPDNLDTQEALDVPDMDIARDFLAKVGDGEVEEHDAVGLGRDLRISAPGIVAGGLLMDSSLLHLVAFAELPDRPAKLHPGASLARSRHRRHVLLRDAV